MREAEAAGADFVGGEDMVEKIQKENWTDYDAVIATPDMMKSVGKLGKVLGPRGLMPNPKTGTVTFDVASAVKETKAGKVEFRTDKTALVHVPVGKISFPPEKLVENAATVITSVIKAKPSVAKGKYIKGCYLSSTMGPGVVDRHLGSGSCGEGISRRVLKPWLKRRPDDKLLRDLGAWLASAESDKESKMAVTKAKKIEQVEKLTEELQQASHAIVGTFAKLTVEKDFELRKAVRGAGGRYRVVKNTLAERAAKGTARSKKR